jgi:hypothetical protein
MGMYTIGSDTIMLISSKHLRYIIEQINSYIDKEL